MQPDHTATPVARTPRFDASDRLALLYREIGISAVAAALHAGRADGPAKPSPRNPLELPPLLREIGFAA